MSAKLLMSWGKWKNEPIEDLPTGYIEWCLGNVERLSPAIKREMEAQLEMRQGHGVQRRREDV